MAPLSDTAKHRLMRRTSLLSLGVGSALIALKTFGWWLTGSLGVFSSLVDSGLDVVASGLNVVALRYALQPPDREHRFGHGKAEDMATLAQSAFIGVSAFFLMLAGIGRLWHGAGLRESEDGIAVMLVSLLAALALALYERRVARVTGSSAIKADALHYFTDFLCSLGVLIALLLARGQGWVWADGVIALLIALYMMAGAVTMGRGAFNILMDHEFSEADRSRIKQMVLSHPDVLGLHELRTRQAGLRRFIQFHLDLDEDMTLKHAHAISEAVEHSLLAAFPAAEILIHQDPKALAMNGDEQSPASLNYPF